MSKLTSDVDLANDLQNTNTNAESHIIKKRAMDDIVELNDSGPVDISVELLKQQVDDLVENYNKLARTLNRPQLHETNIKSVGLTFFFQFLNVFLCFLAY